MALRPNHREKATSAAASSRNGAVSGQTSALLNGLIDPTKTGKYPVLLSKALLEGTETDVFTGMRYNHRPQLSSDSAPALARLKPETPGNPTNFDMSYVDDGGRYGYSGTRSSDKSQYVLYFDPDRKAFILDKLNSTFNMNLTRTPDNTDPDSLSQQFQHLDTTPSSSASSKAPTAEKRKATALSRDDKADPRTSSKQAAPRAKSTTSRDSTTGAATKPNRKQAASSSSASASRKEKETKKVDLALPKNQQSPAPASDLEKDKRKSARFNDDDEDGEDDDDDLQIEFPGAAPPKSRSRGSDFSPAFPAKPINRRFSDFLRDSEADDEDGESDLGEEEEAFKLPSPEFKNSNTANARGQALPQSQQQDQSDGDGEEDAEDAQLYEDVPSFAHEQQQQKQQYDDDEFMDIDADTGADQDEMDLEADLEAALEAANSGDAGEESEVSEED